MTHSLLNFQPDNLGFIPY